MIKYIHMIIGLILCHHASAADTLCGSDRTCVAIHCGKTVICNKQQECTMLDGDYNFFKQGMAGTQIRYNLERVTVAIGPARDILTCIYMANTQMVTFVYKTNEADKKLTVFIDQNPDSINYGWDYENHLSYKYSCNAKEYDCPVYH